jgi:hypothetical protein
MQFTLFDPTAGRMLRDLGLASVEFNNLSFVQAARTVLDKLIEINGKATMAASLPVAIFVISRTTTMLAVLAFLKIGTRLCACRRLE